MVAKRASVPDEAIYSTHPEFEFEYASVTESETLQPADQSLTISLNRRKIDGALVTTIMGFVGKRQDLLNLLEEIGKACRSEGSAKMYDIILSGDVRKKAYVYLHRRGFGIKIDNAQ